jgi:hypothetical protein
LRAWNMPRLSGACSADGGLELVDETPPGYVNGKWVLVGFLLLFAGASTAIVLISRDFDRKAEKARAMEDKLGREVGPEDSPKEQKRMERFKKAAE